MKLRLFCLALLLCPMAQADYFLNGPQKLDLIEHGQMNGEDGNRYDVWVVPGYMNAVHTAHDGWHDAGQDLKEYGQADTYTDAWHHSKSVYRFGAHDTLHDFALKGTVDSWKDAFSAADERTHKRVFGWWFAYPWAVIEGTGLSIVRLGLGVPGGVLIAGVGAPVTPVVELSFPAVKSVYHATIPGTVVPVIVGGWNTVVSPPLALLGQQPSVERADGFWMKVVDPETGDPQFIAASMALAQLRRSLAQAPAVHTNADQEKELGARYEKQRQATLQHLQDQYYADRQTLDAARQQALRQELTGRSAALNGALTQEQLQKLVQRYGRPKVAQLLVGDGLSEEDANTVLAELVGPTPGSEIVVPPPARRDSDKTNPIQRTLDIDSKQY